MSYTPQQLATRRRELAQEYRQLKQEMKEIKKKKAFKMIELMAEHGSKAKAEVYYFATKEGQREIEVKYECEGLIELIRAAKTEIDIMVGESMNQY